MMSGKVVYMPPEEIDLPPLHNCRTPVFLFKKKPAVGTVWRCDKCSDLWVWDCKSPYGLMQDYHLRNSWWSVTAAKREEAKIDELAKSILP